jgi:small GTP-binding protein
MSNKKTKNYDYQFKIVMIGDTGVGKSSILRRFVDGSFSPTSSSSTVDVDFKHHIIKVGKNRVKFQIWDTAGQEQYNTITTAYYRGAEGIFVVYDTTSENTLKHVSNWVREVDRYANEGAVRLIAGNKVDISEADRTVPEEHGRECAQSLGALFFEVSAKDDIEINEAFQALAVKLISVKGGLSQDERQSSAVRLTTTPERENTLNSGTSNSSCC